MSVRSHSFELVTSGRDPFPIVTQPGYVVLALQYYGLLGLPLDTSPFRPKTYRTRFLVEEDLPSSVVRCVNVPFPSTPEGPRAAPSSSRGLLPSLGMNCSAPSPF